MRGELETEQTATYWPQIPLSLAALLSRSAGLLSRGSWEPSLFWELFLTTASYLQLIQPVCGTGLYNCLTSTCFLWASHLHPIQPVQSQGYTLISYLQRLLFTQANLLFDSLAEGQYATVSSIFLSVSVMLSAFNFLHIFFNCSNGTNNSFLFISLSLSLYLFLSPFQFIHLSINEGRLKWVDQDTHWISLNEVYSST